MIHPILITDDQQNWDQYLYASDFKDSALVTFSPSFMVNILNIFCLYIFYVTHIVILIDTDYLIKAKFCLTTKFLPFKKCLNSMFQCKKIHLNVQPYLGFIFTIVTLNF